MRIAIFGKQFSVSFRSSCSNLFRKLNQHDTEIIIYKPFYDYLMGHIDVKPQVNGFFESSEELVDIDLFISIGGDGTMLKAVTFVRDSGIPIVGINSGRLGFLADIAKESIDSAIDSIFKGDYTYSSLDLLQVNTPNNPFGDMNFALNELAVHRRDTASMISIHTYIDNEFLNSYFADGLIVATAVGSTAYSLSVGGPIIHPKSKSLIISPISSHNLTVRPIVVPNDMNITLKVEGRADKFLVTLDSRSRIVDQGYELNIRKADFCVNVIDLPGINFNSTLRNKLMWGADKRNY
ncbi:NAD+ kinase [Saccharicrinis carchari]|uniref:NAD kinase n=1 Tax=Saccharicrinis carchari TaxID=1168039 RepID=A0A521CJ97_SACCC|nr:NAD kinase [Saccharicrinis carchari]SMO58770.1 NAD+ kinase [Saccharicrinis carchari]